MLIVRQTPNARSVLALCCRGVLFMAMFRLCPKQLSHGHCNSQIAATILAPLSVVTEEMFDSLTFLLCKVSRSASPRLLAVWLSGMKLVCKHFVSGFQSLLTKCAVTDIYGIMLQLDHVSVVAISRHYARSCTRQ